MSKNIFIRAKIVPITPPTKSPICPESEERIGVFSAIIYCDANIEYVLKETYPEHIMIIKIRKRIKNPNRPKLEFKVFNLSFNIFERNLMVLKKIVNE
jgi:hypothetical protein